MRLSNYELRVVAAWSVVLLLGGCTASEPAERSSRGESTGGAGSFGVDRDAGPAYSDREERGPVLSVPDVLAGGFSCSADLRSILDDKGHVARTCAAAQGCANGQCVAACDAATANHGSVGCDFYVSTPAFDSLTPPPCFVVFLTNGWTSTATLGVSLGVTSYDPTLFARVPSAGTPPSSWPTLPATGLAPNQVAVLFLSSDPASANQGTSLACPVATAASSGTAVWSVTGTTIDGGPMESVTGRGTAWHITSNIPLNAYDVLPFGGALSYLPSAQLLLPTSAWGNNYVAALPPSGLMNQTWGQVIAAQDHTRVDIVPTVDLPSGTGIPAAPRNILTSLSLDAGEVLQWQWSNGGRDMSGSIITSDKPVLFVGGHGHLCMRSATSKGGGCDSEHELVPPVSALGHEYALAPYATRRADLEPESALYRIVGTADGTVLTVDPPGIPAPAALARGQVVDFETTSAFAIASQDSEHPFWISQQMPGCNVVGGSRPGVDPSARFGDCLGDDDDVGMVPPAQWLSTYVFFTDPTYATTNLILTRVKDEEGFHEVNVDCLGSVTGWQPVGANGTYEFAQVDLVRAGKSVGSCENGPHVAKSDGPFGLVVWGLDSYSSYSYPAGGNAKTINSVIIEAIPR